MRGRRRVRAGDSAECQLQRPAGRCNWPGAGYFFFAAAARGFAADLGLAFTCGAEGASPMTPFNGHILKAGHFWQPATMAMGQIVMVISMMTRSGKVCAEQDTESSQLRLNPPDAARSLPAHAEFITKQNEDDRLSRQPRIPVTR